MPFQGQLREREAKPATSTGRGEPTSNRLWAVTRPARARGSSESGKAGGQFEACQAQEAFAG